MTYGRVNWRTKRAAGKMEETCGPDRMKKLNFRLRESQILRSDTFCGKLSELLSVVLNIELFADEFSSECGTRN
jgi:hypothetical protein